MRIQALIFSALLVGCSEGGPGAPTVGDPSGGFGSPGGGNVPALVPPVDDDPPQTGGGVDSGTKADTSSGGTDAREPGTDTARPDTSSSGDPLCDARCPSDSTPGPFAASCNATLKGSTCQAEARAFWECAAERLVCTEGRTDQAATLSACSEAYSTYTTCTGGGG